MFTKRIPGENYITNDSKYKQENVTSKPRQTLFYIHNHCVYNSCDCSYLFPSLKLSIIRSWTFAYFENWNAVVHLVAELYITKNFSGLYLKFWEGSGCRHALALSDTCTSASDITCSLFCFLFYLNLLSIFLIESLNILHKHPGRQEKRN